MQESEKKDGGIPPIEIISNVDLEKELINSDDFVTFTPEDLYKPIKFVKHEIPDHPEPKKIAEGWTITEEKDIVVMYSGEPTFWQKLKSKIRRFLTRSDKRYDITYIAKEIDKAMLKYIKENPNDEKGYENTLAAGTKAGIRAGKGMYNPKTMALMAAMNRKTFHKSKYSIPC